MTSDDDRRRAERDAYDRQQRYQAEKDHAERQRQAHLAQVHHGKPTDTPAQALSHLLHNEAQENRDRRRNQHGATQPSETWTPTAPLDVPASAPGGTGGASPMRIAGTQSSSAWAVLGPRPRLQAPSDPVPLLNALNRYDDVCEVHPDDGHIFLKRFLDSIVLELHGPGINDRIHMDHIRGAWERPVIRPFAPPDRWAELPRTHLPVELCRPSRSIIEARWLPLRMTTQPGSPSPGSPSPGPPAPGLLGTVANLVWPRRRRSS